jgi:GntR family transcriptional regulator
MLLDIDPQDSVPIYAQIIRRIKWGIASGALADGSQLPSVRELATRLRVNPNTIVKAYRELEYEGFVQRRHGQGTYVSASGEAVQAEREEVVAEVIDRAAEVAVAVRLSEEEACRLLSQAMGRHRDAIRPEAGELQHG